MRQPGRGLVKTFMFLTFVLLGVVYWQMSGGADFQPQARAAAAVAAPADPEPPAETDAGAGADRIVLTTPAATATQEPARTGIETGIETAAADPAPVGEPVPADPPAAPVAETEAPVADADDTTPGLVTADLTFTSLSESAELASTLATDPQPEPLAPATEAPAAEAATEPALDLRVVAGSRVNMRQGPGTNFAVMDTLDGGTEVEVLEVSDNGWARLRVVGTDEIGWMAERLLSDG